MGVRAGDDAFDIALDTDDILGNAFLGPLARGAVERVAPGLDPEEALFPITRGPLGLPSLLPLPKLERLYFRCRVQRPRMHEKGFCESCKTCWRAVSCACMQLFPQPH